MSASPTDLPAMDPVLAGVYRRGYSIRRQRVVRRLAAGALSLQLLVALPFAFRQGDDAGGRNVRVVAPATQEEPAATTTTEVPVVVDEEEDATSTTVIAAAAPTTSTTALVCRNSTDSRCGPFRWDPDPGPNAPLTVELHVSPEHPKVGEEVTLFVRAVDPDAEWFWGVCQGFGDTEETCISGRRIERDPSPDYCAATKYGPWTPPPRVRGDASYGNPAGAGYQHVYSEAGTYTASFSVDSFTTMCGLHEPYGSSARATVEIVVAPAETTTTTS